MSLTMIDALKSITLHNGIVRVECVSAGPSGEPQSSGTLLIPANQAAKVLQSLVNGMKELEKRIREQAQQQMPTVGTA